MSRRKIRKLVRVSGQDVTSQGLVRGSNPWPYFDDCPICQVVKRADDRQEKLTVRELMAAFRQANERQKKRSQARRKVK